MTASSPDSGGRSDCPDSIANPVTVLCPACMGKQTPVIEGASRPAISVPCAHCRGSHKVEMGWSSYQERPGVHLVWVRALIQVNLRLAYWLCTPHRPVRVEDMGQPTGSPCLECTALLATLQGVRMRFE